MKPKSKLLIFTNWIKEFGPPRLAKTLDVHPTTVWKWTDGHLPRPEQMTRICEISEGRITYDIMVEGAQEVGNR